MIVQQPRDLPAREEHTGFHVLRHRMASQVGAGDEAHITVGDRDLGMNQNLDTMK